MESKKTEEIEERSGKANKSTSGLKTWLGRMGVGAFLFFFIKGLVWLAVFFGLFKACN